MFPLNFAKFLRTPFLQNNSERLPLNIIKFWPECFRCRTVLVNSFALCLILELPNKRIDFDEKKVTATVDDSYVKFDCQVLDNARNSVTWEKDKRIINGKEMVLHFRS